MVAVIFEALPKKENREVYLDMAAGLKPELSKIKGFISIERFQGISNPDKILSLSLWKDEDSIRQWRKSELHRQAQTDGRKSIFEDYKLRVATIIREYGMTERHQAPEDSKLFHTK